MKDGSPKDDRPEKKKDMPLNATTLMEAVDRVINSSCFIPSGGVQFDFTDATTVRAQVRVGFGGAVFVGNASYPLADFQGLTNIQAAVLIRERFAQALDRVGRDAYGNSIG